MYSPLEHDYIGLSETSSMERTSDKISYSSSSTVPSEGENNVLNLRETELRLGLPGSKPPERKAGTGVSLFGKNLEDKPSGCFLSPVMNPVSVGKRGFSDALKGSGKWVSSVNDGSEVDLAKGSIMFSPRGSNGSLANSSTQQQCLTPPALSEVGVPPSANPVLEKNTSASDHGSAPASKAQVVGWPPIRSFRKNTMATNTSKSNNIEGKSGAECLYVKVSMDGAPYLRKVDLKLYGNYAELSSSLEKMFSCFTIGQCSAQGLPGRGGLNESHLMDLLRGSEYVLTYEDKDGDWMLVGDVPWDMFRDSCRRLRIMMGSEAIGLAPRAMEKCKNRN